MFIDKVTIQIKSGDGGDGAVAFHREKYMPAGGPDGGDGGNGGNVIFVADRNIHTLLDFHYKRKYFAQNGENGKSNLRKGKQGEDIIIKVPRGTLIRDAETGGVIADMFEADATTVVMRGGRGGRGNARFATPTRQAPNFSQSGEKTKPRKIILELKTIAEVGLIGFPNVGKSTILSVISNARPKIANYHFTTLQPNLGVVKVDNTSFVAADIPGLIEGASEGEGLGHEFLRHIERTRLLLHVVDISGSEGRDPVEDYDIINRELAQYSEELAKRPQIIVANKSDIAPDSDNLQRLKDHVGDVPIFEVSAATNKGFLPLLRKTVEILQTLPELEPIPADVTFMYEEDPNAFEIIRENELFTVTGPLVDRLIRNVVLSDPESFEYFQRQLRVRGVIDALREKGAKEGSTICIGDIEFDFID